MATLEVQLGLKRYWLHDRTFLKLQGNFESAWKNANLLGYFQITNDSNAQQPVYKPSFKYHAIISLWKSPIFKTHEQRLRKTDKNREVYLYFSTKDQRWEIDDGKDAFKDRASTLLVRA